MNKSLRLAGGLVAVALAATACGSKPSSSNSGSSSTSKAASSAQSSSGGSGAKGAKFSACMVTDTGGIDDRSFNASAWAGMQAAHKANPDISVQYLSSTSTNDYVPNISSLVQKKCGIIITVGGLMADATKSAATSNPNQKFAIVDNGPVGKNVKGLQFNTAQVGYLAGYLAAAMTKTGKVATFGGENIPPVTIYMDGFWEGVNGYNKAKGKHVQVLGWNEKKPNGGSMAGSFTDQGKGKQITENFVQQGADIVFPVAGGTGLGAAAAAKASGGKLNVIWVDTDGCVSAAQYCSVFMTSATKGVNTAVQKVVEQAAAGKFQGGTSYIGTLANGGVGLAPFHDFSSKIPASVQSDLKKVESQLADGTIKLTSKSQPK